VREVLASAEERHVYDRLTAWRVQHPGEPVALLERAG
jgi:hypothetical protein